MKEIEARDINRAYKKAAARAVKQDKELGLSFYTIRNGKLYEISPDGKSRLMGSPLFGLRKIGSKKIRMKIKHAR